MDPSVGRIVHYRHDDACCAAIVTDVVNGGPGIGIDSITVCLFSPKHLISFVPGVAQDEDTQKNGTWHWPEREG